MKKIVLVFLSISFALTTLDFIPCSPTCDQDEDCVNGRCVKDDKGHRGRRGGIGHIADEKRHGGCKHDKDCDYPKKCQGGVCRVVNDDCKNC